MPSAVANRVRGVTLVELLVVVIILAILAAIVVPQFTDSSDDARDAALDTTLSNIRGAIELYVQQHGHKPGSVTAVPASGCAVGTKGTGTGGAGPQGAAALLEQPTLFTDANGAACSKSDTTFKFGPYLRSADGTFPANPITASAAITAVSDGDLLMTSTTTPGAGWKYDVLTGKIIADDTNYATR